MRVGLDARLTRGEHGGIEQVLIGLATGLSKLDDGDEEYVFLVRPGHDEWLRPYLQGPCRILEQGVSAADVGLARRGRQFLEWKAPLIWRRWKRRWALSEGRKADLRPKGKGYVPVEVSDGTIESAGADLVHFPHQGAFLTRLPSIYQPQDLQHLHFPELFSEGERASREFRYRTFSEEADLVVMMTSWGKADLVDRYGLAPEKVAVVNGASLLGTYPSPTPEDVGEVRVRFGLPDDFIFYPAQTWPHKNHDRLLEALARIRKSRGTTVPLVCSGKLNAHFPQVERRIEKLGLEDEVTFTGFVTPVQLRSLYALSRALIFPSRFEGFGLPICEAFEAGVPVASSTATCLPELAGDAAILFDPDDADAIAEAIHTLWSDEQLRKDLVEKGRRRAGLFSWDRSARVFRAHYRRIAGKPLSLEDRALVAWTPVV